MAVVRVGGAGGSVTVADVNADFNRWSLNAAQSLVDDSTSYATSPGVVEYSTHLGSGVLDFTMTASGFLVRDSSVATPPGFDNSLALADVGASVTLYAHPKCSYSGTFIISTGTIDHYVRAGVIPLTVSGINDGSVSESWQIG